MCGLSPCVVVQLKKEVQAAHINQGLCKLVLANVRSPSLFPIVVLTDLQSCWQLMWMNGPLIFTAKPDASTAISIIRLLVQQVRWVLLRVVADSVRGQRADLTSYAPGCRLMR